MDYNKLKDAVSAELAKDGSSNDLILAHKILTATGKFVSSSRLVGANVSHASLESLSGDSIKFSHDQANVTLEGLENYLDECGLGHVKGHEKAALLRSVINALEPDRKSSHFASPQTTVTPGVEFVSTAQYVGNEAYTLISQDAREATEAFGRDIDRTSVDERLNLSVTLMKAYRSLIDRVLPRIAADSNVVLIKISEIEIYDWAKSRDPNETIRYGDHRKRMIDLYLDASPVNTEAKPIVPLAANDVSGTDLLFAVDGAPYRTGVQVNVESLSLVANSPTLGHADYMELISEGGFMKTISLRVEKPAGGGNPAVVEYIDVDVSSRSGLRYMQQLNNDDSAQQGINVAEFPIMIGDTQKVSELAGGAISSIFGTDLANHRMAIFLSFSSSLNRKDKFMTANGNVNRVVVQTDVGGTPVAGIVTLANSLKITVAGYTPDLRWSEESIRKTTLAMRQMEKQMGFEIPVGRSMLLDTSLQQAEPATVVDNLANANSLGNSDRALSIILSKMGQVAAANAIEAQYGDLVPYKQRIAQQFAAGTKVYPVVIQGDLDYDQVNDQLKIMRESEIMTEVHARARARLHGAVSQYLSKSLYSDALEPGEKPRFKVITHNSLLWTVAGITDYHEPLNDTKTTGGYETKDKDSDYSYSLPNGVILDWVGSNWTRLKKKIVAIPVRTNVPNDVTSFGATHDRGTITVRYTLTDGSAANNRLVTNSREIVFPTNVGGILLDVKNLEKYYPQVA